MKIGLDARLWNETGVGRYIRNLVLNLQEIDRENQYVLFVLSKDFMDVQSSIVNGRWSIVTTDIHWHTIQEQIDFPKILYKENLDLVHFPYFSVPVGYKRPFVVTIHDLILHHFPTGKASTLPMPFYYAKQLAYRFVIARAAEKAKKIITVSHATGKQIEKDLHVPKEKIVVTYEGVDKKISSIQYPISKSQYPYFLYVGNAYPHKNLERLMYAFEIFRHNGFNAKLILVGKEDFFYKRLKKLIHGLTIAHDVLFEHEVTDEQLTNLYAHASALVIPSLMEGFGLPGLEAMSKNCLVLASRIVSLEEIYKDACLYIDPFSVTDIADGLEKIYTMSQGERETLQEKGQQQVKKFSWSTMAAQTHAVYESCISLR